MFVEAADIYEKNRDADPSSKLTAEERRAQGGADLGQLQLIAAQVEFGYDNIEDAQKRFGKVIEMHPSRGDLLETAVPYYLDSFRILKDSEGARGRRHPGRAGRRRRGQEGRRGRRRAGRHRGAEEERRHAGPRSPPSSRKARRGATTTTPAA